MSDFYNGKRMTAMDRWDRVMKQLAAEPRRLLVVSLMDVPEERRLPLPDAANSPNLSINPETFSIKLRHHHLPMMADVGYVRWEDEPFCVQRGPNFGEVEAVVRIVFSSVDQLPDTLIDGCEALEEKVSNT